MSQFPIPHSPSALLQSIQRLCFGLVIASISTVVQFCSFSSASVAATLEEIEARGYLIVAVKDNVRPMGFRSGSGQLQGIEIDLARRLAEEILGSPDAVVLEPVTNRDRLLVVTNGEVDLTIAMVTATAARSRLVSFSLPYYFDGVALIVLDAVAQELEDLANQTIALIDGSGTLAAMRYFIPNAQLVGVASYQDGKSLLEAGEADAFAGDASVLAGWVQEDPEYRLLSFQLSTEPLCVVMPKGLQYDELRRHVNGAMERWRAEGWLQERAAYWGLPLPDGAASIQELKIKN